jgi:hypothetical protein
VGTFLFPVEVNTAGLEIGVLSPITYLNRRLRATAHMAFGSPMDREPVITDLPSLKISIIRHTEGTGLGEGEPPSDS